MFLNKGPKLTKEQVVILADVLCIDLKGSFREQKRQVISYMEDRINAILSANPFLEAKEVAQEEWNEVLQWVW